MASLPLTDILTGIKTTLTGLNDLDYVYNYDQLKEGLSNTPALMLWWSGMSNVSVGSDTDRKTFGGNNNPVRQKEYDFHADVYGDPRAHLDKVFAQMLPLVDVVNDQLESQNQKPYFGVEGIKYYRYVCTFGFLEHGQISYPVTQWTITIGVF